MTRLVLVRQGGAEWNRVKKFCGRANIELDEQGIKQAEATAQRLAEWQISAIYSSPLRRALTTAEILVRHFNLEVKPLSGLIDVDYGEWQNLSPAEAAVKHSALYSTWLNDPNNVKFPGGENLVDVRKRTASAINGLIDRHSKETIILVSHKVVCQVLILSFLGLDNSHFWEITQDAGAISVFEVRGGVPSALLLNDTCHLKMIS